MFNGNINKIKRFFARESVYAQLRFLVGLFIKDSKRLRFNLEISDRSYTNGVYVNIGLPKYMIDKSKEEIMSCLKALTCHETEHVYSSNFNEYGRYINQVADYLYAKHRIRKEIGMRVAQYLNNSLEDGRIERLHGLRFPGNVKHLKGFRIHWWINQPVAGENEFNDFLFAICTKATTGLYPKNFEKFYDNNSIVYKNLQSIDDLIELAVLSNSHKKCCEYSFEIIRRLEDYIVNSIKSESDFLDMLEKLAGMLNADDISEGANGGSEGDEGKKGGNSQGSPVYIKTSKKSKQSDEEDKKSSDKDNQKGENSEGDDKSEKGKNSSSGGSDTSEKDKEGEEGEGTGGNNEDKDSEEKEGEGTGGSKEDSSEEEKGNGEGDKSEEEGESSNSSNGDKSEEGENSNSKNGTSNEDNSENLEGNSDSEGENSEGSKDKGKSENEGKKKSYEDYGPSTSSSSSESDTESYGKAQTGENEVSEEDAMNSKELEKMLKEALKNMEEEISKDSEVSLEKAESLQQKMDREEEFNKAEDEKNTITQGQINDILKNYGSYEKANLYLRKQNLIGMELDSSSKAEARFLKKQLQEILINKISKPKKNRRAGQLDPSALWKIGNYDTKVFQTNKNPNDTDYVIYILIDGSGSMAGEKWSDATRSCSIIEEAIKEIVPLKIVVFNAQSSNIVNHYVVKNFHENKGDSKMLEFGTTKYFGDCGNKDGFSIRVATQELLNRSEKRKILIVLSDGEPSAYRTDGRTDVKKAVVNARKKGIDLFTIFFGDERTLSRDINSYKIMYDKGIIACLPKNIITELSKILRKNLLR